VDLEPVLETIPKIIATHTGKLAYNYLASRVKERIERNWELMSKDMCEKVAQGDPLRNDWFAENEVLNNRIPFRLLEKTIREISNDSAERKSEYIAKFWVNICLTSNADIDEATAFSYLETIESLSWRQLCIIGVVILYENKEVNMSPIGVVEGNIGAVEEKDLKHIQMSQDEWTRFYSISRDFKKLIDNNYLETSIPTNVDRNEPFLDSLHAEQIPDSTHQLHSLMNLYEIPDGDIEKTFSIWNVKRRKSEKDSQ